MVRLGKMIKQPTLCAGIRMKAEGLGFRSLGVLGV